MRRYTEVRVLMFLAGCAATIGATWPVHAMTEAEAADELIAVLGVTLPCPYFAVAWLEPPTTIEYRCTPSIERGIHPREALPRHRVGYIIDMQIARERFASAYRFRRKPTPTVELARLLTDLGASERQTDTLHGRASALVVYRRATASAEVRDAAGASGLVEVLR